MFDSFTDKDDERGFGKTLPQWATFLAVTLGVSTGLCGVTAFVSGRFNAGGSLFVFGILELIAMILSAAGFGDRRDHRTDPASDWSG